MHRVCMNTKRAVTEVMALSVKQWVSLQEYLLAKVSITEIGQFYKVECMQIVQNLLVILPEAGSVTASFSASREKCPA